MLVGLWVTIWMSQHKGGSQQVPWLQLSSCAWKSTGRVYIYIEYILSDCHFCKNFRGKACLGVQAWMFQLWTQHDRNAARKTISLTCRSALQRSHPGKSGPKICSTWSSSWCDSKWTSKPIFASIHKTQSMGCLFCMGRVHFGHQISCFLLFWSHLWDREHHPNIKHTHTPTLGESSWDRWVSWLSTKTMVLRPERRPDCPKDSKLDIWPISAIMGSNCK